MECQDAEAWQLRVRLGPPISIALPASLPSLSRLWISSLVPFQMRTDAAATTNTRSLVYKRQVIRDN